MKTERVYFEITKELLEEIPSILKLVREKFGEYIIEGEIPGRNNVVSISFYTNKLAFKEGSSKQISLTVTNENGKYILSDPEKCYSY